MNDIPERNIKFKETRLRTLVKTILLRIIVFIIITFFVMIILKGTFEDGVGVALLDIVIELISYYIYERIWQRIEWGIVYKETNDKTKTYRTLQVPKTIKERKEEEKEDVENDIENNNNNLKN